MYFVSAYENANIVQCVKFYGKGSRYTCYMTIVSWKTHNIFGLHCSSNLNYSSNKMLSVKLVLLLVLLKLGNPFASNMLYADSMDTTLKVFDG